MWTKNNHISVTLLKIVIWKVVVTSFIKPNHLFRHYLPESLLSTDKIDVNSHKTQSVILKISIAERRSTLLLMYVLSNILFSYKQRHTHTHTQTDNPPHYYMFFTGTKSFYIIILQIHTIFNTKIERYFTKSFMINIHIYFTYIYVCVHCVYV